MRYALIVYDINNINAQKSPCVRASICGSICRVTLFSTTWPTSFHVVIATRDNATRHVGRETWWRDGRTLKGRKEYGLYTGREGEGVEEMKRGVREGRGGRHGGREGGE